MGPKSKTAARLKSNRIGVIDVGSNSVRLVVFDGIGRSPSYFYNEKVLCGLGQGTRASGMLNPEGRKRALAALNRFSLIAGTMKLDDLRAVATAAVREARDGPQFCSQVQHEFGIKLKAISGKAEAKLAAKGVRLGWPQATGLVCDIGGSSMELAALKHGEIKRVVTSALGPLSISDAGDQAAQERFIKETLSEAVEGFKTTHPRLFLVGGSWRAIARLHMNAVGYPLRIIQDYSVTPTELRPVLEQVGGTEPEALQGTEGISSSRLRLVPTAARVLLEVLDKFEIKEIAFSSYGLREGLYLDKMPKSVWKLDPLLESVQGEEAARARFPGFGAALFDWVKPLFKNASPERLRVIEAACYLHDVYWRSHPDYRAEVSFDGATHADLGGLAHSERVFLAWALLYRYKSKGTPQLLEPLRGLITEEDRADAKTLGRAMRMGAMMNGEDRAAMGDLRLHEDKLELLLDDHAFAHYGEAVQKRFAALAEALCVDPHLRII